MLITRYFPPIFAYWFGVAIELFPDDWLPALAFDAGSREYRRLDPEVSSNGTVASYICVVSGELKQRTEVTLGGARDDRDRA